MKRERWEERFTLLYLNLLAAYEAIYVQEIGATPRLILDWANRHSGCAALFKSPLNEKITIFQPSVLTHSQRFSASTIFSLCDMTVKRNNSQSIHLPSIWDYREDWQTIYW